MIDKDDTCGCAAHGCPLLGTMTASTGGASEWWCFIHHGADVGRYQALTAEINRRPWLAAAVRDIRSAMRCTKAEWATKFAFVQHELALNQRSDLQWNGSERVPVWGVRLETEIQTGCREIIQAAPPRQARVTEDTGSFNRVGFDVPEPA